MFAINKCTDLFSPGENISMLHPMLLTLTSKYQDVRLPVDIVNWVNLGGPSSEN